MNLYNFIFTYEDILNEKDHKRFIHLCKEFDFGECDKSDDNYYELDVLRSHIQLCPNEHKELWQLSHKVAIKTMPKIYANYENYLPKEVDLYNKYSGYWLCKYPVGGRLSNHADLDGDSGSVTISYTINDDYEGGELRFWDNYELKNYSNSVHIYPSNFLYPHKVTPVTKGDRYSIVCWFGYQKGNDWS